MSKNSLIFTLGLIPVLLIISLIFIVINLPSNPETDNTHLMSEVIINDPIDLIKNYFDLLDKGDIDGALELHSEDLKDLKEGYLESYTKWKSVELKTIDKINEQEGIIVYMVLFDLNLAEGHDLIFSQGDNMRFITLRVEGENYRIMDISTGP